MMRRPLAFSSAVTRSCFAVSPDRAGKNIPRTSCTQGWLLRQELLLGNQDAVPTAVRSEPIRRGITDKGYYIWRAG